MNDRVGRIADRCAEGAVADSEDDLNLYAYTRNDPLNLTDPTGECPWCIVIGAAIGGGAELVSQLNSGEGINVTKLAIATGAGALGGGATGAILKQAASFGAKILANSAAQAGISASATQAKAMAEGNVATTGQVLTSAAVGATAGALGPAVGRAVAGTQAANGGTTVATGQVAERNLAQHVTQMTASAGGQVLVRGAPPATALSETAQTVSDAAVNINVGARADAAARPCSRPNGPGC